MRYFISELMAIDNCKEVDRYVEKYIFEIPGNQRAKLSQFANHRKAHICALNNEKKQSHKLHLN
jgi:hypothetical protein